MENKPTPIRHNHYSFNRIDPPKNLNIDSNGISDVLRSLGLNCDLNTPDKINQYAKQIRNRFPNKGNQHITANLDGSSKDYDYTIDDQEEYHDKMMVILEKLDIIQEKNIYPVQSTQKKDEFKDSTDSAIQEIFVQIGQVMGTFSDGHLDPDQLESLFSDNIVNVSVDSVNKNHPDYKTGKPKTSHFIFHRISETDFDQLGGFVYSYNFELKDIENKKSTQKPSSYSVEQSNIIFSDVDVFLDVYYQVKNLKE
ncbi:hypothetical protein EEL32_09700 [Brevibacillus laterosporus]|nr:hypothetical protein [Brevibacillus laterosporus]TPG88412.1 hypothetical protein EEL32_09700 [Brevibacillus laterosporus]